MQLVKSQPRCEAAALAPMLIASSHHRYAGPADGSVCSLRCWLCTCATWAATWKEGAALHQQTHLQRETAILRLRLLPLEGVLSPHTLAVHKLGLPGLDVAVQIGDELVLIMAHPRTEVGDALQRGGGAEQSATTGIQQGAVSTRFATWHRDSLLLRGV